jgi:NitT/TauT family transport system substrate-binding protein
MKKALFLRIYAACIAIALTGAGPVHAEVSELNLAQQYGVSFLPLMWMERNKLIEKHAKAAGLGDLKVGWIKLAGPAAMNDALLSGSLHFASAGVPALVTLWARTKGNMGVQGVTALASQPMYLNIRNPNVKSLRDLTEADKIALPAVKVSSQAIMLQMAAEKVFGPGNHFKLDSMTLTMAHPDALAALTGGSSTITGHFTVSPFHDLEIKTPGIRTLMTSRDIFGGRVTANVITTTAKFREANPKTYGVFLAALKEAVEAVNRDPRASAQFYLDAAGDRRSTVDEVLKAITDPDYAITQVPEKVFTYAEFMYRTGAVKEKPASWKDLFFPEIHGLPGS